MAERRMFTKKITESDEFLDMPLSAQALYVHLNMAADDDGFVNNSKKIQRMAGASADDLQLLIEKNFLIEFNSGIVVIRHWLVHNQIRKDRYHETSYTEEKSLLEIKKDSAYMLINSGFAGNGLPNGNHLATKRQPNDNQMETEVRLGKDRLGKGRLDIKDICSDLSPKAPEPEPELADVEAIPLNNGSEYKLPLSDYEEYLRLYPGVDIKQEFRNMRGWCLKNPAKRKTPRGVGRFINGWLAREQDRGGRTFSGNGNVIAGGRTPDRESVTEFAQRAKEWAENG